MCWPTSAKTAGATGILAARTGQSVHFASASQSRLSPARSPMRTRALHAAILLCLLVPSTPPVVAQVDQQRAQEFFKEAKALCERDAGRLWGVSICAPMVIGD